MDETESTVSATPIQVHIRLGKDGWKVEITYSDNSTKSAYLVSYLPHQLGVDQIKTAAQVYIYDLGCVDGNLVIGSDGVNFTATWQGG